MGKWDTTVWDRSSEDNLIDKKAMGGGGLTHTKEGPFLVVEPDCCQNLNVLLMVV